MLLTAGNGPFEWSALSPCDEMVVAADRDGVTTARCAAVVAAFFLLAGCAAGQPAEPPPSFSPLPSTPEVPSSVYSPPSPISTDQAPPTPPAPEPPPVREVEPPPAPDCDPNYEGGCVPIASDVDCEGGSGNGPEYVAGPVAVVGEDIYGLDSNSDGEACES